MLTQNLHTHCTFCDGKDLMEDMVKSALRNGLNSLGFSSHAYSGLPLDMGEIRKDDIDAYFAEISRLKGKYRGQIEIFAGFEYESRNQAGEIKIDPRCEYSIGSVHLFKIYEDSDIYSGSTCASAKASPSQFKFFSVDLSPEEFTQAEHHIGGIRKLCENYFDEVLRFAREGKFDIAGHFDLVTKFIETGFVPDFTTEKWYRDMSLSYLEETAKTGKIFEINTGAISRAWRTTPYPSLFLLKRLKELNALIIVSSDAHSAGAITQSFKEVEILLKDMGFKTITRLTKEGFKQEKL